MAVMENIRAGANNPWMKAVFAIIVLVFVFWGVGGAGGPTNTTVAEVNGKRITDTDFQRLMRQISRSQGDASSDEEQSRIAQFAIEQLIQSELMLQTAAANGIEVSAEEIADYLGNIDEFKDSRGEFSQRLYKKNLKRMGFNQGRFEQQIRDDIALFKLRQAVSNGVRITDGQLRRQYMKSQTKMTLKMVRIPDSVLLDDVEVDEGMLAAFMESNKADIRARYEEDFKRLYKKSRRASLRQILIKTEAGDDEISPREKIDSVLTRARAGEDFAALALEHSQGLAAANGGDIGTMAEEQLSPSVAAAVFKTEAGQITDVITTNDGLIIMKVGEIIPAETIPFETVSADIAKTITAEKNVGGVAQAYADKILESWKTNGSPDEAIMAEQGVIALETPVFAAANPTFPGLSDSKKLVDTLTKTEEAGLLLQVFPVPGGRILAEVTSLDLPSDEQYNEDKSRIGRLLEAQAKQEWVQTWEQNLAERANVVQHYRP
ncbi:MAG: SurA N-terminal domain-containing protein [Myxococcota bacterium]